MKPGKVQVLELKYNMSPERVFLYVTLLLGVVVHQLLMAEDTEPILYSRFTRKKTELPIKAYNIKPERGDLPDNSSFITSPAATTIPQTPYAVAHSTTATTTGPFEADVAVTDSGSVRTTTNAHTSVVAPVSATNTFFAASNTSMASWTPTNYTVYLAMKSESPVVCKCSTDDTQSEVEKATTMSQQFGRVMSLALRALDSKAENKELSQQIVNLYKEQTSALQDLTNQTLSLQSAVANTKSLSVKNVRVHNQLKSRLDAVELALKATQSKDSAYDLFRKLTQKNITYLQDLTNFLWLETVDLKDKTHMLESRLANVSKAVELSLNNFKLIATEQRIVQTLPKYDSKFKPRDCDDLALKGHTMSGVYEVWPVKTASAGIQVYCRMSQGRGWLVLQNRRDGLTSFSRSFVDYEFGFGSLYGDFWLGNHYISLLTLRGNYQLKVELVDWQNNVQTLIYRKFHVEGAQRQYKLTVEYPLKGSEWSDPMLFHNGNKFTAPNSQGGCADTYSSGWWFTSSGLCFRANLNGNYSSVINKYGIIWKGNSLSYPIKYTSMEISRKYLRA